MPLTFRNNSGLGENFSSHSDLLSKISDTLTTAGWTCSTTSLVLTAASNTEPFYFKFDAATAGTLKMSASLDSGFTGGNVSAILSSTTTSNKLWMLAEESLFIIWLNDSTTSYPGFFYGGVLDKESPTDSFAWGFGRVSIAPSNFSQAGYFLLAKSLDGNSKWVAINLVNVDPIYFSGTASKDTGSTAGFTLPVHESSTIYRGNLRYVLSGVSGAPALRILTSSAANIAYNLNPDPDVDSSKLITEANISSYPKWQRYIGNFIVAGLTGYCAAFKISN